MASEVLGNVLCLTLTFGMVATMGVVIVYPGLMGDAPWSVAGSPGLEQRVGRDDRCATVLVTRPVPHHGEDGWDGSWDYEVREVYRWPELCHTGPGPTAAEQRAELSPRPTSNLTGMDPKPASRP